ncbi:hypothetical protein [Prosthecobacter sp.]|uniref:hypothetical protein n=1 Tax=Prosthecobacter sp. TaxID=1965333 RepID=UPI0037842E6E
MKSSRVFCLFLSSLFMTACGSVAPAPKDSAAIVLSTTEERECGQGVVRFPAGVYVADVVSPKGTYYLAPQSLRTVGVLLGRSERGGIFVSNAAGNPQAAWFGDTTDVGTGKPSTLFGAIGINEPKLWPYSPRIPFQVKK